MSIATEAGLDGQLSTAKRNVGLLAVAQAILGSAPPLAFAVGGLAGFQMLGADKSLSTAPLTGFNIGVAVGAIVVAAASRVLGRRESFMVGALMGALGALAIGRLTYHQIPQVGEHLPQIHADERLVIRDDDPSTIHRTSLLAACPAAEIHQFKPYSVVFGKITEAFTPCA